MGKNVGEHPRNAHTTLMDVVPCILVWCTEPTHGRALSDERRDLLFLVPPVSLLMGVGSRCVHACMHVGGCVRTYVSR